ncbi:MAG: S8 family serine peptidase [Nocardioides sp.]
MSPRPHHARRLAVFTAGLLIATGTTGLTPAQAAAGARTDSADPTLTTQAGTYLVTLIDRPAAAHSSTRPGPSERFDRTRPAVKQLAERLRVRQDRVLEAAGDPQVLYRWTTVLNGFAARLDEAQVKVLRADPRVALVERSTVQRPASDSAGFLGLPGAGGAWSRAGGPAEAGKGVVVGVVDSGIWPENPSFAGLPQQRPGTSRGLPGFHGDCAPAEQWKVEDCNTKVVSARWFLRGFGLDNLASTEIVSARDSTGHGSHDASTAAGERRVNVLIDGQSFGSDSGMAPAARLAVYKACWTAPDPADDGCSTADTVAAVDRAVADGVDVLSYSVAGSSNPQDTLSRAFLSAASAGVFVAAAAGNRVPGDAGVGNAAPWVTTVGASTHRLYQGAVRLGDGRSFVGAMASDQDVQSTGVVLARDAAADGSAPGAAARCEPGSLDAAVVADQVVVCERGEIARVDKSSTVSRAGGAAMVLVNTVADSVEADVHALPTVHLDVDDAAALTSYLRESGDAATASLDPDASEDVDLPTVAPFSARGPLPGGDLLKPDLTAPGVAVVGAVAPPSSSGRLWDLRSGTSVSAPHVAGLAAFLLSVHPTWSPARLKSAMMTTADHLDGAAGPFAEGAGQVDPEGFLDPGLVLDSVPASWRRFLDGEIRPQDLNLPSVAVDGLVGRTTVVRRLTNVGRTTETYTASVTGLDGVAVRVRPRTVTLRPGQTRAVRIRLTATPSAPVGDYARGRITWTGLTHQARMPVVVRTASVAAPEEVGVGVDSRRIVVDGRTGTGRPVQAAGVQLAPADPVGLSLRPGDFDVRSPASDADTFSTTVTVTPGSEAARFEVAGNNAGDDLDVYVFRDGELVEQSNGRSAREAVTLLEPAAGDYTVYVHAVGAGNGATSTGELSTWVLDEQGDGDGDVEVETEQSGTGPGAPFRATVSWGDDLDPTRRWFGVLSYVGSDQRTVLRIG